MTVKPPAPPPLPDELDRLLRRLRLPYVRKRCVVALAITSGAAVLRGAGLGGEPS